MSYCAVKASSSEKTLLVLRWINLLRFGYTLDIFTRTGNSRLLSDATGIVKPECCTYSQGTAFPRNCKTMLHNFHRIDVFAICRKYCGHLARCATAFDGCGLGFTVTYKLTLNIRSVNILHDLMASRLQC